MATATSKVGAARAQVNQLKPFSWEGVDKRGIKIKGESFGKSANLIKAELRKQGINPGRVAPKREPLFGRAGSTIKAQEIAIFSRQLATMIKAGVPMVQSFEIIAGGQKNVRMKDLLNKVKVDIEGGSSLSESIAKHPIQFDELYVNLVRAGETAGVLDVVLDTIATYKENLETLKGKIKKALFYPAMVFAVAIIVTIVLLIYVVPMFEAVFKQYGADLPAFTKMIVESSNFFGEYWWLIALIVGGSATAIVMSFKRSKTFAHAVDRMLLRLPIVGQILHNSAIARFSRTLAVTFAAGVPLVEALDTVGGATGSVVYEEAVRRIKDDVSVGYQLNLAMRQAGLFPNMVVQMVAIGEESGALDTMLYKIAEFYEQEVNNAVDVISSLIEPFIMIFIGIMVGGMVVGMYLPIFKLALAF